MPGVCRAAESLALLPAVARVHRVASPERKSLTLKMSSDTKVLVSTHMVVFSMGFVAGYLSHRYYVRVCSRTDMAAVTLHFAS